MCYTSIALSDKWSSVCMRPCGQVKEAVEGVEAGRDIKQCFNIPMNRLQLYKDSVQVEVNIAMALLQLQVQPSGQPFSCRNIYTQSLLELA